MNISKFVINAKIYFQQSSYFLCYQNLVLPNSQLGYQNNNHFAVKQSFAIVNPAAVKNRGNAYLEWTACYF